MSRLACAALIATGWCCAQADAVSPSDQGTEAPAASLAQEVELLADGIVASVMRENGIPGLTLSVVKDGAVVLAKGYGYADLQRDLPVDADRTLFRIGSVTKTFTWTAIMQLVEQGKIDLDEDVNAYLADLRIPAFAGTPLTLRDIMAHRSGFEDGGAGYLFETDPEQVLSFESWLQAHMPARVRAPGEAVAYSNYAAVLAGLIVENVSGLPYDEYLAQHVFAPWGMHDTTVLEPLGEFATRPQPDTSTATFATGYVTRAGRPVDYGFEYITGIAPAGAGSSTAADMAAYMLGHLQMGKLGDARVLKEATVERMRTRAYTDRSAMNDFAHGFLNGRIGEYEFWGHGGITSTFATTMLLWPELQFGVFVSINQTRGAGAASHIPQLLLAQLFSPKPASDAPSSGPSRAVSNLSGTYLSNRRSYTALEKILQLSYGFATVEMHADGQLQYSNGPNTSSWFEVAPLVFRNAGSGEVMTFDADASGRIVRMNDASGYVSFDRVGFLDSRSFLIFAAAAALLFACTTLIGTYVQIGANGMRSLGWADHYAAVVAFGVIATSWLTWSALGSLNFADWPSQNLVIAVWAVHALAVLLAGLAFIVLVRARSARWTGMRKLHRGLFMLAGLLCIAALGRWNVLGFQY